MTKEEFINQANEIIENYKIADNFFDLIQKAYDSSNFSRDSRIINTTHSHLALLGLSHLVARIGVDFESALNDVDYYMFECYCGARPMEISCNDEKHSYKFYLDSLETFYDYLITAYDLGEKQ